MAEIDNKEKPTAWWMPAVRLLSQVIGWIAAPIIVGIYLGQYLDAKFQTEPRYFYICVAAAFVLTNVGLFINVKKAAKEISQKEKTNSRE